MPRARRLLLLSRRRISLTVCLSLIVSCLTFVPFERASGKRSIPFLKAHGQQNGSPNGQERRVTPVPPQPGPPPGNLPNLDELRGQMQSRPVQAPPSIPSTMRSRRKTILTPPIRTVVRRL